MAMPAGCASAIAEGLSLSAVVIFAAVILDPAATVLIRLSQVKETESMECGEPGCIVSTITCVTVVIIPTPPAIPITVAEVFASTQRGIPLKPFNPGRKKAVTTTA